MSQGHPADNLQIPERPQHERQSSSNSVVSVHSVARLPGRLTSPEDLLVGDGAVSQRAADLLGHALDPSDRELHPQAQNGRKFPEADTPLGVDRRPWYRKPSAWWILPLSSCSAFIFAGTLAPRTEIYIKLVCAKYRPEYYSPFPDLPTPPLANLTYGSSLGLETPRTSFPSLFLSNSAPVIMTLLADNHPLPAINLPQGDSPCNSDPVVLAEVAKLVTVTTLIVGVLTCLVTGWWGQLSDRRGRTRVWGFAISGALVSELALILVTYFYERLPGGYWFLVVGSIVDGLLGGLGTSTATSHAYISDCTQPSSRAKMLSLALGFVFIGVSIGPAVGSFLIRHTNDLLAPFYVAVVGHLLLITFVWMILPESLSVESRKLLAEQQELRAKEDEEALAMREAQALSLSRTMLNWLRRGGHFLTPLAIFLPRARQGQAKGKDWNLTYFVVAYWIAVSYIALYPIKMQYAIGSFGWSSVELGFWLSIIGIARGTHLVVLLPVAIKIFKPKPQPIALPIEPNEPLNAEPAQLRPPVLSTTEEAGRAAIPEPPPSSYPAPPGLPTQVAARFDLQVARVSLLIDIFGYMLLSVCGGMEGFIVASLLGSFAGGFFPSAQSLALLLATPPDGKPGENGKIFGALAVLQALGSQILGPALFGSIYISTVGTHPKTVFIVATGGALVAMVLLLLIRIPKPSTPTSPEDGTNANANDPTLSSTNGT